MVKRVGAWLGVLAAAALTACGGPEKTVVDQYFNAVKAGDNQTLSSFATVPFNKPVESWRIVSAGPQEETPVVLPDLVAKVKDLEAQLAANKKAYGAYSLDHFAELEKVQEARRKNASVSGGLTPVAAKYDEFNQKDRELKRALGGAKDAVEKERRNVRLSVGEVEGVEALPGKMLTKKVDVEVSVKNENPQTYAMTLRKYELQREGSRSRWVVQALQPK
jgi:hypothetical protein